MKSKMLQTFERFTDWLMSKKRFRKSLLWCLEHIKLKYKHSILHDSTFITFGYEFFVYDEKSDGCLVFLKRRWTLAWLLSPKGWSHVAVWDFKNQNFKDFYFQGNRAVAFTKFLREYDEILVYRTKAGFVDKFHSAMTLNKMGRMYCTGLVECANTLIYPHVFEPGPMLNPSPYNIIKRLNRRRFPTFHIRYMKH
jgi:hypothetical protein